jgi:hypothetical protein
MPDMIIEIFIDASSFGEARKAVLLGDSCGLRQALRWTEESGGDPDQPRATWKLCFATSASRTVIESVANFLSTFARGPLRAGGGKKNDRIRYV